MGRNGLFGEFLGVQTDRNGRRCLPPASRRLVVVVLDVEPTAGEALVAEIILLLPTLLLFSLSACIEAFCWVGSIIRPLSRLQEMCIRKQDNRRRFGVQDRIKFSLSHSGRSCEKCKVVRRSCMCGLGCVLYCTMFWILSDSILCVNVCVCVFGFGSVATDKYIGDLHPALFSLTIVVVRCFLLSESQSRK